MTNAEKIERIGKLLAEANSLYGELINSNETIEEGNRIRTINDTLKKYITDINSTSTDNWYLSEFDELDVDKECSFSLSDINPFSEYPNEEYAKKALRMKQFNDILLAYKWCYDRDYEPDWSNIDENKYGVEQYYYTGEFRGIAVGSKNVYGVVFSTHEIARSCADFLNEINYREWIENDNR